MRRAKIASAACMLLLSATLGCATASPPAAPSPPNEPAADAKIPPPGSEAAVGIDTADARSDESADESHEAKRASGELLEDVKRRAAAAFEGMIVGTVIGGQVGQGLGAAIGATLFGLYGLITGDVPFDNGGTGPAGPAGPASADSSAEVELEDVISEQRELEDEIEAELRRQEELLESINQHEAITEAMRREEKRRLDTSFDSDPKSAPAPPFERDIPDTLFEREIVGKGKDQKLVKSLDSDRDGRPEIEIVYDGRSGELLSRSEDTDYDGLLDTQNTYEDSQIVARNEDTNHDGQADRWTEYVDGTGTRVEVDRDFDGRRDGFYTYVNGTIEREEHDTNGDGRIDRRVEYHGRTRALELEDSSGDGQMDIWIYYDAAENPIRIERDKDHDGNPDIWEHYQGDDPGNMVITRKDEDLDHDGIVDVKSHYRRGKLNRKEVLNPEAL